MIKQFIEGLIPQPIMNAYVAWKRKRELPKASGVVEKDAGLYWNTSERSKVIRDMSHWRGEGQWADEKWRGYGELNFGIIRNFLQAYNVDFLNNLQQKALLEWGPGGGANMILFCENFGHCVGVDISEANLAECKRQMTAAGHAHFQGVEIPSDQPEKVLDKVAAQSIDFITSLAVFQHFPSKDYAKDVLKLMAKLAKPQAYGMIQIRYDDGNDFFKPKAENYFKNALTFTSFQAGEFDELLTDAGFEVITSERDLDIPETNYEYYFFQKAE